MAALATDPATPPLSNGDASADDKEARFMAALQKMVGHEVELTEETMRSAMASLTPAQRRKLDS